MTDRRKRGSLQSPCEALRGVRQLKKTRRTISRLTLFRKAIHGVGGLALQYYVLKRRRHLRNSSQNKFIELLLPNTETYKNTSYFGRTVKD